MSSFILHDSYFDPVCGRISSYFCRLFVLIDDDSVQYCILDTEKNCFIAIADYHLPSSSGSREAFTAQVGHLLMEDVYLSRKYPSVVIGISSHVHTLVPSVLFDAGQVRKYLEFNFRIPEGYHTGSNPISEINSFSVYGFPPGLITVLRSHFREAAIVHRSSALIKTQYQLSRIKATGPAAFLNINKHSLTNSYFEDGSLLYFNTFPYQTREDILYFTLYSHGQSKPGHEPAQLIVSGFTEKGSDVHHILEQYFHSITFADPPGLFGYSPLLAQASLYRYVELFALALCES
jgi:hypothetical protein